MKQRVVLRFSEATMRRLKEALGGYPPGLRGIPLYPGQAAPKRPKVTPEADPVSAVFDRQGVIKGAS